MLSAQISPTKDSSASHLMPVHRPHFTSVRHTEDQRAADRVAKSGQLVRNRLPTRGANVIAGELDFLELDAAILAKFQLSHQAVTIPRHDRTPSASSGVLGDHHVAALSIISPNADSTSALK